VADSDVTTGEGLPGLLGDHAASPSTPSTTFVYAIGKVEPRFGSLGVEKEFAQITGRTGTSGLSDRQAFQAVLSDHQNRYLARQLCWVFTIAGLETYLLVPRDRSDLELLVQSVRPTPGPADLDVVVGLLGPLSRPEACGLVVPLVAFDQLYSFDRDSLVAAIPEPENISDGEREQFTASAAELLDYVLQLTDNAGASDRDRALNYLCVRYSDIYTQTFEAHQHDESLVAVDVQPARLDATRAVVDVVFSYRHRRTDVVRKRFVRVDVTEEFPFLVTKLSPYVDR